MKPFTQHSGKVYALDRADVDTDQIVPKQFLKRVERTGFGEFLFYDWRNNGEIVIPADASVLVAGRNFGCGSSREHAPWALDDFGFRVVIASSFADIFYNNCTKIGLLPIIVPEQQIGGLMRASQATVDLERQVIETAEGEFGFEFDSNLRERFLNGLDDIAMTLQHEDKITKFEKQHAL